jgi:hypothetical protein
MTYSPRHTAGVQKRKSTSFKACLRCHRRKQRCTGFPVCSNCQSADATCERDTAVAQRKLAGLSKEDLLDRIDLLEARLGTVTPGREPDHEGSSSRDNHSNRSGTSFRYASGAEELSHTPQAIPTVSETGSAAPTTSPVLSVEERIQNGPWPDSETREVLLTTYLDSMYRRVPFFDLADVLSLHNVGNDGIVYDHVIRFRAFKLYMIYAIGSTVLNLTMVDLEAKAQGYIEIAQLLKQSLGTLSATQRIEATLFDVLYRLRISLDSNAWYEIGSAMRIAVEAGMHRESYYTSLEAQVADWRRRLFWGVYIMERNISFSFRRPLSISDHDIDTSLPPAEAHTVRLGAPSPENPSNVAQNAAKEIDLNTFVAVLTLVRIKSRTYSAINRLDHDAMSRRNKLEILLADIRDFEETLPGYAGADQDFIQLHVNNTIRTLIEPFLTMMEAEDILMKVCVRASGKVCQLFKQLRLRKALGYSFPMVNSVFVSGMTMCYIVFRNTALWTPALANDLRACSSILFVIAERNHGLRKYCDLLEIIIDGVMQYIEQASEGTATALTNDQHHQIAERPPIPFHKLKDTFKQMNFELPATAYPSYTAGLGIPEATPEQSTRPSTNRGDGLETTTDTQFGPFADTYTMDGTSRGPETFAHMWDMNFAYDFDTGDGSSNPFAHEPYTQQMVGELLGRNPFYGTWSREMTPGL